MKWSSSRSVFFGGFHHCFFWWVSSHVVIVPETEVQCEMALVKAVLIQGKHQRAPVFSSTAAAAFHPHLCSISAPRSGQWWTTPVLEGMCKLLIQPGAI